MHVDGSTAHAGESTVGPSACPSVAATEGVWQSAEWYRALTINERLQTVDRPWGGHADCDAEGPLERLREWRKQEPLAEDDRFVERLATDGLSEHDLLHLLAESPEDLQLRIGSTPDWLSGLRSAFGDGSAAGLQWDVVSAAGEDPFIPFLPALAPLLQRGLTAVQQHAQRLAAAHRDLPIADDLLPRAYLREIAPIVLFQVSKPIALELHFAKQEQRLHGASPEDRFKDFVSQLTHQGGFEHILVKYPVLGRQLVGAIDQWVEYLCEFMTHLCEDWQALRTTLAASADPGPLTDLEAGKGDRHRRGRSVMLVRFASGLRLVYKPRSLAIEGHFQELLAWLNEEGAEPRFRTLGILDRGSHGWAEFVASSSCTSHEEVTRFFERQGSYLAVLYALGAADLHNENLIAAGEHPVLVDLEALFHPHFPESDPVLAANLAAGALDRSVWQVGILPRRVWSDEESVGVDMSGLGGQAGQMNPHRIVRWIHPGTDKLRLVRARVELPASENRPRLLGQEVDGADHRAAVIAGFVETYRLLCRHRNVLLAEQLDRFAHDEVRVVVRNTNVYGLLWYESFHPDLLRDGLDREQYFDRLWVEQRHRPYLATLIPAERRDLQRGDIPVFTTRPDSRTLVASEGETYTDFLQQAGLELARQRVAALGEDDLTRQAWIVEASLATLVMDRESSLKPLPASRATSGGVTREDLLSLADAAARRLEDLALQDKEAAYWLGVGPLDGVLYGLFPTGVELYAGAGGIALFLGYLGAVTDDRSHTRLARRALTPLRTQVRNWAESARADSARGPIPVGVGAFEGFASVAYVLSHLGILWGDTDLLDEADEITEALPSLIRGDERLDVMHGSAGCILSLLSLHAVRPRPRILDVALECGERLLATAQPMAVGTAWSTLPDQPPLGGFSHGTAGIAFSLLRLAGATSQPRFRDLALSALAFDRSLFRPEINNWEDRRVFPTRASGQPGSSGVSSMVAWCHGAAGIGLGRLAGLDQVDDRETRKEIDHALAATVDFGFAVNHSLCHGALGNLEFLLTASQMLDRQQDHEALRAATSTVVASIKAHGWVSGVPLGVETPGFMTGLAGMGYELLRLAEPATVPCALLLAPPAPISAQPPGEGSASG